MSELECENVFVYFVEMGDTLGSLDRVSLQRQRTAVVFSVRDWKGGKRTSDHPTPNGVVVDNVALAWVSALCIV